MIDKGDLKLIMICAFRYSLGRRTYMPSTIVDLIINNSDLFNEYDWKRFIKETKEEKYLGDNCDIQTWNKLIEFSEKQMKNK